MSSNSDDRDARIRKLTDQIIEGIKELQDRPIGVRVDGRRIAESVGVTKSTQRHIARGAEVEIVELGASDDGSVIIPNEIRINGQSILCPDGEFVTVHPVGSNDLVSVTITMFVSKLTIKQEKRGD